MHTHQLSITQAILLALCTTHTHTPCSQVCEYALENCPTFWRKVFLNVYGENPKGISDEAEPRWNELFKEGYAVLRTHAVQHMSLKTAS